MSTPDPTLRRYLDGDYAQKNPDWDSADALWKVEKLMQLLHRHRCQPGSVVEVGCGSGAVLMGLRGHFPAATLSGFDISPQARSFWANPAAADIRFEVADYLAMDEAVPDLVLLFDVLEHVGNPWEFLDRLRGRVRLVAIHFPLDLSVLSVLRESPLLKVRNKVGHLHYFTRGLALALLEEAGYEIIEARYTGAALEAPQRSWRTRLAGVLRRAVYAVHHDLGARLLGGETLMVLARPRGIE